ncbi:MAG: 3-methyl-2-oxobutanoate dehydrogenase subunit VorB [Phycisphaerae bacterium]|nr:3-methyl-2-oxobutanoate dehydrogenase subunit VorB [Phycisphaerae bacterium]
MPDLRLVKGNEAICYGAVHGGCEAFFGYPITPQNEVPEIMSWLMPKYGRAFLQAESEIASINMIYGASGAGKRAMSSSSSPGISLMMEGISYIAGAELPCVLISVQRGGPGLGNIAPSQSDYFQAVKGGGHGDYNNIVLAPWNAQEMYDHPRIAFELADKYRMPVIVLTDAVLGSMLEPARIPDEPPEIEVPGKPWAACGRGGRDHKNVINSLYLEPEVLSDHNDKLQARYATIREQEKKWDTRLVDDAEFLVAAYGISARIAFSAIKMARERGLKVGLFRPVTLWPFPSEALAEIGNRVNGTLVFELSGGQMLEDVRLALPGRPVEFFGKMGGVLPSPSELCEEIFKAAERCNAGSSSRTNQVRV